MRNNWFNTLNEALESENILEHWDCLWSPISYGETRRFTFKEEDNKEYQATIYRETNGKYERPIIYQITG